MGFFPWRRRQSSCVTHFIHKVKLIECMVLPFLWAVKTCQLFLCQQVSQRNKLYSESSFHCWKLFFTSQNCHSFCYQSQSLIKQCSHGNFACINSPRWAPKLFEHASHLGGYHSAIPWVPYQVICDTLVLQRFFPPYLYNIGLCQHGITHWCEYVPQQDHAGNCPSQLNSLVN